MLFFAFYGELAIIHVDIPRLGVFYTIRRYMKTKLTKQSEDFPKWYQQVIEMADLAEHGAAKGSMIIKPYGYAIWERMQRIMDDMIKEAGVDNAYFPLLIPKSFLDKEANHVEGFAPEVAWVTKGGGKDLDEPLAIRPTSETTIGEAFSRWTESYRDLPIKINQWANVVRWELRPRLFLRTNEFLWQEGHTIHATPEEAQEEVMRAITMYKTFVNETLAMHVVDGYKPPSERFAGALETTCIEAMMKDGKALQMGTSHDLGQNFAKAFDIQYSDQDGERKFVHQTSWGVSTRMVGGLIMAHGDDKGLKLPPNIAPYQVVIIPIWKTEEERTEREAYVAELQEKFGDVRVKVDWDDNKSPGWKFSEWELKGVPVRVEIGGKEQEERTITAARRDTGEKENVGIDAAADYLDKTLKNMQDEMLKQHKAFTQEHTHVVDSYDDLAAALQEKPGFFITTGEDFESVEKNVKQETSATIRVLPFDEKQKVYWAKAY